MTGLFLAYSVPKRLGIIFSLRKRAQPSILEFKNTDGKFLFGGDKRTWREDACVHTGIFTFIIARRHATLRRKKKFPVARTKTQFQNGRQLMGK